MPNNKSKLLALILGTALTGSVTASEHGNRNEGDKPKEEKCEEMKCGAGKCGSSMENCDDKSRDKDKDAEGSCGSNKDTEGSCGANK